MPENVGWIHRRVGTRQIVNMLEAGIVEEIKWWSLWCLPKKPFLGVTTSDFELKDSKLCPDLPLAS